MFIIQGPATVPVYIWTGANLCQGNSEAYTKAANEHVKLLQKHEKASSEVVMVAQGEEPEQFWELFFTNQAKPDAEKLYGNVNEWNNLIIDLATVNHVKQAPLVNQM